ncbi:transposase [Okeania sp. SIO3B5]|uniref:transposase n=1 Tax=Okeania sp. SIO3B5 TaxID=2607811 RepID=UPI0025EE219C|nr:transposase [Okeania sp. SIO3B5]
MVKNRKLSRAISDLGWRQFRTFLEGKAEKYGRDFRVISRWEPTSQICSNCGFKGGKLDLKVREWECLNCGAKHVLRRECSNKYISRSLGIRRQKTDVEASVRLPPS